MVSRHCWAGWLLAVTLLGCVAPTASGVPTAHSVDADAGEECTVGVASGRATRDGRPLLWKNRDAKVHDNVVTAFNDGKWPYVGITNAGASNSVWGGANAAGFCIMNSLSRDLPQGSKTGPGNGPFMKLALRTCATVADFEALLQRTDETGRRTRANFGVIDAGGAAAFFETGHGSFRRFDADETDSGVLVRANFAVTGGGEAGRDRFERAGLLCQSLPEGERLTASWLLRNFVRDLTPPKAATTGDENELDARETIHRQTTVASMVFEGCRPDEDARCTTMWALLGQPIFSVAVPCWPAAGRVAPAVAGSPKSPICDAAQAVQAAFYREPAHAADDDRERTDDEAGPNLWLLTKRLPAARDQVLAAETKLMAECEKAWQGWRKRQHQPSKDELYRLHARLAAAAQQAVEQLAKTFAGTTSRR